MDADVDRWIRSHLPAADSVSMARVRPWGAVAKVRAGADLFWFKACGAGRAFEARLSAELSARHPDRVGDVLAHDPDRGWLLLADAGRPLREKGNPPEAWLRVLPAYAELQRVEAARVEDHLAHGVPDLRPTALPAAYEALVARDLPGPRALTAALRRSVGVVAALCEALQAHGVPASVQHDDLHDGNLFDDGDVIGDGRLRVLDWGDSSVGHPFASLVVTFRFLEERNGLAVDDPWFARLRDAYLEPWGDGHREAARLALRLGRFAQAVAWWEHRAVMSAADRDAFDVDYVKVLHRAVAGTRQRRASSGPAPTRIAGTP